MISARLSLFLATLLVSAGPSFAYPDQQVHQHEQVAEIQTHEEKNVEIQQRKQEGLIPQSPPTDGNKIVDQKTGLQHFLGKAWNYFNRGQYDKAAEIFKYVRSFPEMGLEADFGLSSCYIKQNKIENALPLLEKLVSRHFHVKDTLPELMDALLKTDQLEKAKSYVKLFGSREREKWEKRLNEQILNRRFAEIKKEGDVGGYIAFMQDYGENLQQCNMLQFFYETAGFFANNNKADDARTIYDKILACPTGPGLRLGVFYALKPLLGPHDFLSKIEKEESRVAITPDYAEKLISLKVDVLHGLLESEPGAVMETASTILKIRPNDNVALAALSWWHFRNEDYDRAYNGFLRLHEKAPAKKEYVIGMINALTKLNRFDEAFGLASKYKKDKQIASMAKDIRLKILWDKVAALPPDAPELEDIANEILSINPAETGAVKILAWQYYNAEDYDKAYVEFKKLYSSNPLETGTAFGLASTLVKLSRLDEALEIAVAHDKHDDKLPALETDIYLSKAKTAYAGRKYHESQTYFEKVMAQKPDDTDIKKRLELSKYKQTLFGKAMSAIEGLPGYTWGNNLHYMKFYSGNSPSISVNQGIDWVKLPGDILLNTYGEYRYTNKTNNATYINTRGEDAGIVLKKSYFKLGTELSWDYYPDLKQTQRTENLYLSWYYDWYKYVRKHGEESWWNIMEALTGSTYGRMNHDFANFNGTGISGFINQGIDWVTLPGDITFNTYAEYRFGFRTKNNLYYNAHGPALGIELQKKPFRLGMDYYWEFNTEQHSGLAGQHSSDKKVTIYLKWYYNWDLKPRE